LACSFPVHRWYLVSSCVEDLCMSVRRCLLSGSCGTDKDILRLSLQTADFLEDTASVSKLSELLAGRICQCPPHMMFKRESLAVATRMLVAVHGPSFIVQDYVEQLEHQLDSHQTVLQSMTREVYGEVCTPQHQPYCAYSLSFTGNVCAVLRGHTACCPLPSQCHVARPAITCT
jgi:hypothetical protein